MAIDKDAIREHVRGILAALGDDPDREGLKETPDRVARMYEEVFEGMNYTNHEIAMMFNKSFKDDLCVGADKKDIVLVADSAALALEKFNDYSIYTNPQLNILIKWAGTLNFEI